MKTKKLFVILLAALLVLAALPSVSAAEVVASGICGQVNEAYSQWDNDGDNVTWTLTDDGVLTVSGTGKMNGYYGAAGPVAGPWRDYRDQITTVVVNEGVENVGVGAFARCNNLTTIILADSVKSVDYMAFSGSRNVSSLTIADGTVVAPDSFNTSLLPSEGDFVIIAKINLYYYRGKGGDVIVPDGIKRVVRDAIADTTVSSITFPDGIEEIGFYGMGCYALRSVTIGNGLTTLPRGTFDGCPVLSTLVLPESLTTIEAHAVVNCPALTNITIPRSVTAIAPHALGYNCRSVGYVNDNDPLANKIPNFTITGYTDTAAETYAKENGFTFIALDKPEPEDPQPTTPSAPEETPPTAPSAPEDTQPTFPPTDSDTFTFLRPSDYQAPQTPVPAETPAPATPLSVATGSEAAPAAALMLLGVLAALTCGALAARRRKE